MEENISKNIIIVIISIILVFVFGLIGIYFTKKDDSIYVYFFTEGGTPVEKIKINKGDKITLPNTTKDGYIFLGWYKSGIKVSNHTRFNETSTLFAEWVEEGADTFTIKFDSNEGTEVEDLIVECNKALKLPLDPVKEGYKFVSWLDKNNNPVLDESILKCEDITLKAEWKKEDTKEETKEVTYTCPNGYTLNNKKCSIEKKALEKCPNGSTLDGDVCLSQTDINNANNVCKNMDIETEEGIKNIQGEYFNGKCGYYVYSNLGVDDCTHTFDNGKCYAKVIEGNFDTVCSDGYLLKENSCIKIVNKELYCESGYNLSNNKCVRTIDATIR